MPTSWSWHSLNFSMSCVPGALLAADAREGGQGAEAGTRGTEVSFPPLSPCSCLPGQLRDSVPVPLLQMSGLQEPTRPPEGQPGLAEGQDHDEAAAGTPLVMPMAATSAQPPLLLAIPRLPGGRGPGAQGGSQPTPAVPPLLWQLRDREVWAVAVLSLCASL